MIWLMALLAVIQAFLTAFLFVGGSVAVLLILVAIIDAFTGEDVDDFDDDVIDDWYEVEG